jgi:hypothetical protein
MTHFVTRTVPSPRTDHSLRHRTTRVGLRARRVRISFFRENVRFGRFLWAIANGFRHPGHFLETFRIVTKYLYMTFYEVSIDFWTIGSTFHAFYGSFRPRRKLLAQTEAGMTHISTRTVPSPRTGHSLRHSTTRVVFGPDGFEFYFFAKNSVSGDFREL